MIEVVPMLCFAVPQIADGFLRIAWRIIYLMLVLSSIYVPIWSPFPPRVVQAISIDSIPAYTIERICMSMPSRELA